MPTTAASADVLPGCHIWVGIWLIWVGNKKQLLNAIAIAKGIGYKTISLRNRNTDFEVTLSQDSVYGAKSSSQCV